MTDGQEALVEQVEMNLLFVRAELETLAADPEATQRALEHVEMALRQLSALRRGGADNVVPFCRGAA